MPPLFNTATSCHIPVLFYHIDSHSHLWKSQRLDRLDQARSYTWVIVDLAKNLDPQSSLGSRQGAAVSVNFSVMVGISASCCGASSWYPPTKTYIYIYLVGGIPTPLKNMKVSCSTLFPIYGKIKHVHCSIPHKKTCYPLNIDPENSPVF